MYTFTRDHLEYKAGDEIKEHDNLDYLVSVGVLEKVEKKHEKEKKDNVQHTPKNKK